MGLTEENASSIENQSRDTTQNDREEIYIKVFFTAMRQSSSQSPQEFAHNIVADHLHLRDIKGSTASSLDVSDKINTSFVINCSDLYVNDDGYVDDPEGQDDKIEEAAQKVVDYLDGKSGTIKLANVHIAVVGFDIVEDTVRGFSYLCDQANGLNLKDEQLKALVLQSYPLNYEFSDWNFYTEYVGVFEHHVLFQPITQQPSEIRSEQAKPATPACTIRPEPEHTSPTFELSVEENGYLNDQDIDGEEYEEEFEEIEEDDSNWLDNAQLIAEGVGLLPVVGEVVNLANGFVYLGREIHAGVTGDFDKMYKMRDDAIVSFIGAIPASELIRGGAKVTKAVRGGRTVEKTGKALEKATAESAKIKKSKGVIDAEKEVKTAERAKNNASRAQRQARNRKHVSLGRRRKLSSDVEKASENLKQAKSNPELKAAENAQKEVEELSARHSQEIAQHNKALEDAGLTLQDINVGGKSFIQKTLAYEQAGAKTSSNLYKQGFKPEVKLSQTGKEIQNWSKFDKGVFSVFTARTLYLSYQYGQKNLRPQGKR